MYTLDMQNTAFITLMKCAITGEKKCLPYEFSLEKVEHLARQQNVSAMLFYGALNCGFDTRTDRIMQSLFRRVCQSILLCQRQSELLKLLSEAFERNAIDYMPLKGAILREMYPKIEMRMQGDVDILIRTEQYDRIRPLMCELGFTEGMESEHELKWTKGGLLIELHKQLFPTHHQDYHFYFGDGWRFAQLVPGTQHRFCMTDEDQFVYLFAHFAKHYRSGGIGIKHLVDLQIYLASKPSLNEAYLEKGFAILHLNDFYHNIKRLIKTWFSDEPLSELQAFIFNYILKNKAFGTGESRLLSRSVKMAKATGSVNRVRWKMIFRKVFPPFISMKKKYQILKKCPVLLPAMWFVRLLRIVFKDRNRIKKYVKVMNAISPKEITNRRQELLYSGLDINYEE